MDASHWIGSIAFELRAPNAEVLDPFRRALKSNFDHLLRRPVQQALDSAHHSDTFVRHRLIEVDLGSLGPDDWGDQLARRIADGIARGITVAGQQVERSSDREASTAELLLAYLRSGTLPWPCAGQALETICLALASHDEASFGRLAARLKALFVDLPQTARRFVRQCPAKLVIRIAAVFAAMSGKHVRIGDPIAPFVSESGATYLSAILIRLARGQIVTEPDLRWLETVIGGDFAGALPQKMSRADPVTAPAAQRSDGSGVDPRLAKGEERHAEEDGSPAKEMAVHGLPLETAGAILLHPFLAGLFEAVGLLDAEGEFIGEDHRAHAVLLVNYAATGESEQAEPDLVLAKLLCGMEIPSPVPRSIELSDLECSEVDSLLRAAIAHWEALGDTSPAALRETFLERPGRLQRDGDDWRLVVEQRGVDVLLDRLPWAISLVKTPFMPRPLRVDWR